MKSKSKLVLKTLGKFIIGLLWYMKSKSKLVLKVVRKIVVIYESKLLLKTLGKFIIGFIWKVKVNYFWKLLERLSWYMKVN